MRELEKVRGCNDGCTALEDNPREFAEQHICSTCPHKNYQPNGLLRLLLKKLHKVDLGVKLDPDELTEEQFEALWLLQQERALIVGAEANARTK